MLLPFCLLHNGLTSGWLRHVLFDATADIWPGCCADKRASRSACHGGTDAVRPAGSQPWQHGAAASTAYTRAAGSTAAAGRGSQLTTGCRGVDVLLSWI
jgi:hypothetical protein